MLTPFLSISIKETASEDIVVPFLSISVKETASEDIVVNFFIKVLKRQPHEMWLFFSSIKCLSIANTYEKNDGEFSTKY